LKKDEKTQSQENLPFEADARTVNIIFVNLNSKKTGSKTTSWVLEVQPQTSQSDARSK